MPTLEDLLPELAEARIFGVLDVRNGFWHISLDDQSSKLTAFGTPFGKYRWKRLPFGVSTAPEIFQERLNAAIQGIRSVYTVADDILIIGKGSTEAIAREDYDKNLTALLDRCQEKGIKLNGEKCQIATRKVKYMGHVLSSDGLLSDSVKYNRSDPKDAKSYECCRNASFHWNDWLFITILRSPLGPMSTIETTNETKHSVAME